MATLVHELFVLVEISKIGRLVFGLQGRQRPPVHTRDIPWFSRVV